MQSTGQASTQAVSLTPIQGSAMTNAMGYLLSYSTDGITAGTPCAAIISVRADPSGRRRSAAVVRRSLNRTLLFDFHFNVSSKDANRETLHIPWRRRRTYRTGF